MWKSSRSESVSETHSDKPKYPRLKISFWKLNKYLKNNSFMQNIYTHISVTIKRNSFINKSVHTAYYIITLFEFISLQKSKWATQ